MECCRMQNFKYGSLCLYILSETILLFVFFSFMIDYIQFWLALAISFPGNVHTQREDTFSELNSSDIIRSETLS